MSVFISLTASRIVERAYREEIGGPFTHAFSSLVTMDARFMVLQKSFPVFVNIINSHESTYWHSLAIDGK